MLALSRYLITYIHMYYTFCGSIIACRQWTEVSKDITITGRGQFSNAWIKPGRLTFNIEFFKLCPLPEYQ